ncbi:MAG: alpha-amylase family glycosyl hydrolase, partial [Spirochaetota bacterium]|nr:alpha-amylase family glycosyl hydrolase [Spirochaetota bacterium]
MTQQSARIYNLFPRLIGAIPRWVEHFPRVAEMKFNWVFLNPFHYPGFSGSLYSVKDYYRLNPLFYDDSIGETELEQLKYMLDEAHSLGIKVMMDLVVNHTAVDHPFTKEHPEWYQWKDGKVVSPGAWDGETWVSWGDLAEINNESSSDREALWKYWLELVLHYLELGFDGFRCDAAYQLPAEFWQYVIKTSSERYPETVWFAESLGCPVEDTVKLGESGFQYTFNSSKWWDFESDWCLDQYEKARLSSRSVSFPESHDSERLFDELDGHVKGVEQRYLFSSLFSSGVMIPTGFEYGFRKRINVVESMPSDYESVNHDFSDFITRVNELKSRYLIFNEECRIDQLSVRENEQIAMLLKTSVSLKER